MRALFYIPALCLAGATAFAQDQPPVSALLSSRCSIPLLRFTPGDIDPLIVKKLSPASDRTPLVKVPAPPCDEPAAQLSDNRQRLLEQMRIKAFLLRSPFSAKPPEENSAATPAPAP